MRRRRLWAIVLGFLALVIALLVWAAWPGSSTFTVSPETTYITEPLDKDGCVDYVTALNERLRKDITPETNANVLIWQALGPHPEGSTLQPEYFQWLGIECPPEQGDYLVSLKDYVERHVKNEDGIQHIALSDPRLEMPNRPWTAKDRPEIADWLKENEKPLALIMEATRRPEYYNPLVPNRTEDWSPGLPGSLLPTVQKCREFGAALICRAMLGVAEGNVEDAWQDLLACHRLARLVARGATAIELLVGIALDQIANKADIVFLDHASLSSKQVVASLNDLQQLPPMPAFAESIDLDARFTLLETIVLTARQGTAFLEETLSDGKSAPSKRNRFRFRLFTRSINWDPALKNANRWIDRYVAALRMTDRDARVLELAAIKNDLMALKLRVSHTLFFEGWFVGSKKRGEMIGDILIGLMMSAYEKVRSAADRCEQGQRNLHIAFAIAAYQRDHERYPAKLDELAPKYLDTIPDDLFSGKPLIYRLEEMGYLLYSVGVNGIDEGGRGYDDDPHCDDLSVRIPVPVPGKPAEPGADRPGGP